MNPPTNQTKVRLLNRDWQFKCAPNEANKLQEVALHLNHAMQTIESKNHNLSYEETVVMAAINICYELQAEKNRAKRLTEAGKKIKLLRDRLAKKLALLEV